MMMRQWNLSSRRTPLIQYLLSVLTLIQHRAPAGSLRETYHHGLVCYHVELSQRYSVSLVLELD